MKSNYNCPCCNKLLELQDNGNNIYLWCGYNYCAAPYLNNHIEASTEWEAFVLLCDVYESLLERNEIIIVNTCSQCFTEFRADSNFDTICRSCNHRNILSERE